MVQMIKIDVISAQKEKDTLVQDARKKMFTI